ncbi:MAG: PAS domain-containing protein [Hyphomicrobium sp.]|nr:PAS domain-containing protein [Hyphomicrobium sp.]
MREAITQKLYTYWNDIRAGRLAPKRFEIEPSQIASMLPDTFILERIDSATFRFRLAGTRICETFGQEFRGINFLDLVGAEDRVTLQRQFSVIARQGAAGVFNVASETAGGETVRFELLILPLVHMRETVDRFLGSVALVDHPAWIGHEALIKTRILSHDLVWPDGRPHEMIDAVHRQSPFLPHMKDARIVRADRRQFRVYDGGLAKPEDDR